MGVLAKIFKIQVCVVPQKSIFDLFGQKWPARMVTVKISNFKKLVLKVQVGVIFGDFGICENRTFDI